MKVGSETVTVVLRKAKDEIATDTHTHTHTHIHARTRQASSLFSLSVLPHAVSASPFCPSPQAQASKKSPIWRERQRSLERATAFSPSPREIVLTWLADFSAGESVADAADCAVFPAKGEQREEREREREGEETSRR